MKRLKLDDARQILPPLDELRPLLDHALARSLPDPRHTWSGSGELATVGTRLVLTEDLSASADGLARQEHEHLARVYRSVAAALQHLERGDGETAAATLLEAAALEEARDRPDRAEAYARAAYTVARDEPDRRPAALALRRWARALRSQGKLDEAAGRYAQAYRLACDASDGRGAAEAAIGAGNVLEQEGRWRGSEGWYRTALASLDQLQEVTPERWHALLNLHIVIRSGGAPAESIPFLEQAEEAARAIGDTGAEPFLENARGQLQMSLGAFERAESHLRAALESTSEARSVVTIRLNLAETLLARGCTLLAAEQAREAERTALAAALVPKLPEVYRVLGRIAASEDNPGAFVLFERAIEIIRERRLPVLEEALTLQAYAEAEISRGEEDSARHLLDLATERYRSLGITRMRSPWADVYGPQGGRASTTPSEEAT